LLSRVQQELTALQAARPDFDVSIAGPSAVVGPGDDKFFGRLVRAVAQLPLPLVPRGGFNFIAINDVAAALTALLEGRGQRSRYPLVGENMTYRELVTLIRQRGGRSAGLPLPPLAMRLATGMATLLGSAAGRVLGIGSDDLQRYLDQRVYYDPRLIVDELGLKLEPVREVMNQAVDTLEP